MQPPRVALLLSVGQPFICPSAVLKSVRILILSGIKVRKVMLGVRQWQLWNIYANEGEKGPTLLLGL
jgi:hypothetical protein